MAVHHYEKTQVGTKVVYTCDRCDSILNENGEEIGNEQQ